MALVTEPGLRSGIRKRLTSDVERPDPYALSDPTKPLGRPAMSGLESAIGTQAMGLNYDVNAERTARQNLINQGTQESEQKLARMFAIQPSGVTGSGESLRNFETLESGKTRMLNELEAELSTKAPEQTRMNLQALMGVQQGREQAGFQQQDLNLRGLGQAAGFAGQEEQLAQSQGALSGYYGGALTEEARARREQERQSAAGITGRYGGEETLASRLGFGQLGVQQKQVDIQQQAQNLADRIQTGQLTIQQASQALDAEVQRGRLNVDQADQILRQAQAYGVGPAGQQTLGAKQLAEEERRNKAQESLQSRGVAVTEQSLAEEVRRNQALEGLQARGVAVTEKSLNEEIRRNQALEGLQSRGVAVTEKSLNEEIRRNQALEGLQARGVAVTEKSLNEEIRRNQALEGLQARGVAVTEKSLDEEIRRNKAQEGLQARGVTVTEQSLQEEIRRNRAIEGLQGRQMTEEERRNQALEGLQARGVAVTERSLNEEIRQNNIKEIFTARTLSEQERQNIVMADLQKRGQDINHEAIQAQIRQQDRALSQREQEMYGGTTVKNADGSLTFNPTMAYKDMDDKKKLAYAQLAEETRSNKAREDAAWQERTGISVGVPGTIAFSDFSKDFGKTSGFDPKNDFNNDGKVDEADYFIGADQGKIVQNNTTMTTVQRDQVNQNIKQSAAAIDMDEKQFELKSKSFFDSVSQWKSQFAGILLDADGNLVGKEIEEPVYETREVVTGGAEGSYLDANAGTGKLSDGRSINIMGNNEVYSGGTYIGTLQGGPQGGFSIYTPDGQQIGLGEPTRETRQVQVGTRKRTEPITSLQREQFTENRRQFEASLAEKIREFEKELGFEVSKFDAAKKASFWSKIGQIAKVVVGAGAMAVPGGQTIGAGILGS